MYTRDPKLVYLGTLLLTRAPSSTRPEPVEAYGCMKRYHPNIIHLYCPNHATKVGGEENEAKLSKQSSESFRRFGTHRRRKSHRIHTHSHIFHSHTARFVPPFIRFKMVLEVGALVVHTFPRVELNLGVEFLNCVPCF